MNNIQEDDWADDSWSRHSGMPWNESLDDELAVEDENICPRCGQPNGCQKDTTERCWCFDIAEPEQLLQQIPWEKRGKACVCQECIVAYKKEHQ